MTMSFMKKHFFFFLFLFILMFIPTGIFATDYSIVASSDHLSCDAFTEYTGQYEIDEKFNAAFNVTVTHTSVLTITLEDTVKLTSQWFFAFMGNTPLNSDLNTVLYQDETYDLFSEEFEPYVATIEDLKKAGIDFNSQGSGLDDTLDKYIYICFRETYDSPEGFALLIQIKKVEANKSDLKTQIDRVTGEHEADWYQSDDRYNGKDTSTKGFWADMSAPLAAAQEIKEMKVVSQKKVDEATADLEAAIAKLIPITQVNPTLLYESLWDRDVNGQPFFPDPPAEKNENFTSYSWELYLEAFKKGKNTLDLLFNEDGTATAFNVAVNQNMVDGVMEDLNAAEENRCDVLNTLPKAQALYRDVSGLSSLVKDLKAEDYTADSWETFEAARAGAADFVKKNDAPSDRNCDMAMANEIEELFLPLYKGYYWGLTSAANEISVKVQVADNLGAKYPAYALTDDATATLNRTVKLSGANKTVQGLVTQEKLDFSADMGDASSNQIFSRCYVYLNGVFVGDSYQNRTVFEETIYDDDHQIKYDPTVRDVKGRGLCKNFALRDGDELLIVRSYAPRIYYYGSPGLAEYVSTYQEDLCTLRVNGGDDTVIEVKEGEAFSLHVGKAKGIASQYRGTYENAQGVSFVYGDPAESAEAVAGPAYSSKVKTDKDGNASLSLYAAGWYYLSAVDLSKEVFGGSSVYGGETPGTYPNLRAGDGILVHVLPLNEEELGNAINTYLDKLDDLLADYGKHEAELGPDLWKQVQGVYYTAKGNIVPSASMAEAQAAIEEAETRMAALLEQARKINAAVLTELQWYLERLPNAAEVAEGMFSKGDLDRYTEVVRLYGEMTPYQKGCLTQNQKGDIDAMIAAYGEDGSSLPEAQTYQLTLRFEGVDTEEVIPVNFESRNTRIYNVYPPREKSNLELTMGKPEVIDFVRGENFHFGVAIGKLPEGVKPVALSCSDPGEFDVFNLNQRGYLVFNDYCLTAGNKEVVVTFRDTNHLTFDDQKAMAEEDVRGAFNGYQKTDYSAENWAALSAAFNSGMTAVTAAETEDALNAAKTDAIAAMAAVEKRGENDLGSVSVSVRNDTYADAPFKGEIAKANIKLTADDTMMSCVLKTLEQNGYTWDDGDGGSGYDITYIGNIAKDGKSLGQFNGGIGSGWMGSLNDWFVNEGFKMFSVKNKKLHDGDVITVHYTCDLGKDIRAGVEGNSDTSLYELSLSNGTLTPAFDSGVTDYLFVLDEGKTESKLAFSNSNRSFQSRAYLDTYAPEAGSWIRSGETVDVESGSVIYIGVGEKSWPSMGKADSTVYAITVLSSEGAADVVNIIDELSAVDLGDLNDSNYDGYHSKAVKARTAYNALSEEKQATVTNYDDLQAQEEVLADYAALRDFKAALGKIEKVEDITTATDEVNALAEAYKGFSEEQLALLLVSEVDKAEALLVRLDQLAAAEVEGLITDIGEVTVTSEDAINAARKGYDALNEKAKAMVNNYDTLVAAEEALRVGHVATDADAVVALIDAIGEVDAEAVNDIDAARSAYDALSDEAKAMVSNYDVLLAAEEAYRVLKTEVPYADLDETGWYIPAIRYVHANALMQGVGNNEFAPNETLNRGMFVTILYRLNGEPEVSGDMTYSDVAEDTWYTNAVLWGNETGVVKGFEDNTFRPSDHITREQMAAMLMRYASYMEYDVSAEVGLGTFMDAWEVSDWANDSMEWAVAVGLINGRAEKELAPKDTATRAEAAAVVQRFASIYE